MDEGTEIQNAVHLLVDTALIGIRHQSAQCEPKHHRNQFEDYRSEHGAICRRVPKIIFAVLTFHIDQPEYS